MDYQLEREGYHIDRRRFILGLAALATATACGDITANNTPPPSSVTDKPVAKEKLPEQKAIYDAPTEVFPGLPRIDPQYLSSMTDALKNASHPFLNKIGRDISSLQLNPKAPPEFPFWVHRASFPIPIVLNDTTVSKVVSTIKISDHAPERKFRSNNFEYDIFNNPTFGIKLGLFPQSMKDLGPLAEGYVLAKEHITYMVSIRTAMEFMDYLESDGAYIGIKDANSQPFTDKTKRERAGMTYFLYQLDDHDLPVWRVIDKYPMLLLGLFLHSSIDKGEMPRVISGGFRSFYLAANIISQSDRQFTQMLADTAAGWLKNDTFLPPAGTGLKILRSEQVLQASTKLREEMEKLGIPTK